MALIAGTSPSTGGPSPAPASSQRQLAEAQRIAQVGSWEWDLGTDELAFSDELCRIFGRPAGPQGWPMDAGIDR